MIDRGIEKRPRWSRWALAHSILLVPVTLALVALAPITFFVPPMKEEFLVGHDLFVRLLHAAAIIGCGASSWRAYVRGAHRIGVVLNAVFLAAAIIRAISIYAGTDPH